MADQTNIEWADSTFNPWIGCTKVGPGCDHCYAATMDARKVFQGVTHWGAGVPRQRTSDANWMQAHKWNDKPFYECADCHWRGDKPETAGTKLTDGLHSCPECDSLNLIEARRRVFCASLADVFDNEVNQDWLVDLIFLIDATPNLDWLLVTKRIGNVNRMVAEATARLSKIHRDMTQLPRNVWLGITVVNQAEADRDIPKLLDVDASVRFLSMEPLLGAVDIFRWLDPTGIHCMDVCPDTKYVLDDEVETVTDSTKEQYPLCPHCGLVAGWTGYDAGIDWVIVGGESGDEARPMHPDWVRNLRDLCQAAGVPFLFKQWGEWVDGNNVPKEAENRIWFDKKRSSLDMYDMGLLKDMVPPKPPGAPYFACSYYIKVGKKAAGRILDGKTHTEFPEAA